jgi:acetylornithine/succinyldiaminopimelate/putrescine aminotransferase
MYQISFDFISIHKNFKGKHFLSTSKTKQNKTKQRTLLLTRKCIKGKFIRIEAHTQIKQNKDQASLVTLKLFITE